ncbi:MAG: 4-hydroxy-3-methylbut-2-enyl diphosphate reductase [Candidatus Kerfeldbacteria bacterium]|nr:4-hydroxy-3-methylbut-2-enyl diphosphate reductase [Candidatus Kerfeldbacteria bacterium]
MRVLLATPRGFCAGVDRAIDVVELCLDLFGSPVYVRHAIVHNEHVIRDLQAKGAIFVEEISDIPAGSLTVFSAHGIPPSVRQEAKNKKLRVIDATCPLVTRVHLEVVRYTREGYRIILVGHRGHVEVVGTMGEAPDNVTLVTSVKDAEKLPAMYGKLIYLTQTTLSMDDTAEIIAALKARFPQIEAPPKADICYATTNRQAAVKDLAKRADVIFVLGSKTSSNSNRLVETGLAAGVRSYLVDDPKKFDVGLVGTAATVGVTAGASTPDSVVNEFVQILRQHGATSVEQHVTLDEKVWFTLPPDLVSLTKERQPDHQLLHKHTVGASAVMRSK